MRLQTQLAPIAGGGTAVALGYFDGVHLGHRAVLRATCEAARAQGLRAAVFTFSLPHGGAGKDKAILSQTEKTRRVEQLGIKEYFSPPFDSFRGFSPEEFVQRILVECLDARWVFCGENFTFGKNKSGDTSLLMQLCARAGITARLVPPLCIDGAPASSSRVRAYLSAGEVERANTLLGEPYEVDCPVVHGQRLGRTLGFPTINQTYGEEMLIPKNGVYITQVLVQGAWLPSVTGLGTRPTVGGTDVTCETFIPDFSDDLYGDTVRVRFRHYLKPTVRFDNLDALRAYIDSAAQAAREYFKEKV